ncbi:hypothetical protein LTR67_003936 [Exophiala xenobiotica]
MRVAAGREDCKNPDKASSNIHNLLGNGAPSDRVMLSTRSAVTSSDFGYSTGSSSPRTSNASGNALTIPMPGKLHRPIADAFGKWKSTDERVSILRESHATTPCMGYLQCIRAKVEDVRESVAKMHMRSEVFATVVTRRSPACVGPAHNEGPIWSLNQIVVLLFGVPEPKGGSHPERKRHGDLTLDVGTYRRDEWLQFRYQMAHPGICGMDYMRRPDGSSSGPDKHSPRVHRLHRPPK